MFHSLKNFFVHKVSLWWREDICDYPFSLKMQIANGWGPTLQQCTKKQGCGMPDENVERDGTTLRSHEQIDPSLYLIRYMIHRWICTRNQSTYSGSNSLQSLGIRPGKGVVMQNQLTDAVR